MFQIVFFSFSFRICQPVCKYQFPAVWCPIFPVLIFGLIIIRERLPFSLFETFLDETLGFLDMTNFKIAIVYTVFVCKTKFIISKSPHFPEIEIVIIFTGISFIFKSLCDFFFSNINNAIFVNKVTFRNVFPPK